MGCVGRGGGSIMKVKLMHSEERSPKSVTRIQQLLTDEGYICSRESAGLIWEAVVMESPQYRWTESVNLTDDALLNLVYPYVEVVDRW